LRDGVCSMNAKSGPREQERNDHKLLLYGIDPNSTDPEPTAAMARALYRLIETAKQDGNIEPPVRFLYERVDRTENNFCEKNIACKKSCSHCCHTWVGVTAPEVLLIAKVINGALPNAVDRVRAANLRTQPYSFDERGERAFACPLLDQKLCSIYEIRPKVCRLMTSPDANVCARSFLHMTNERIPVLPLYRTAAGCYVVAMAVALRKSNLPHHAYELNAALVRALDTADAERAWLNGDDVFHDVMRDPGEVFDNPEADMMFRYAFGTQ
jgi:Fe-S-cluster containining protein